MLDAPGVGWNNPFPTSQFIPVSFPAVMVFKFSPMHLICCFFKERKRAKIHFHGAGKEDGNSTRELGLPNPCLGSNSRLPLLDTPRDGG